MSHQARSRADSAHPSGEAADMNLKDLKVGDQVMATYVQELGVSVGPAPTPSLKMPKVGNE